MPSAEDSRDALDRFGSRLSELSNARANIGAFQAQINVELNLLSASKEAFAAARSRIEDADIASEAARLVKQNILQQAGALILAQANQQPAIALQLLS